MAISLFYNLSSSLSEWDVRKDYVRRQILVAEGLWPMPTKMLLECGGAR